MKRLIYNKVRIVLILLGFMHGGVALHAEMNPSYSAKPLHTTTGSAYQKKSIGGAASAGGLAVPMTSGTAQQSGTSGIGGGFGSTSSYLNSGEKANLSFDYGRSYSVTTGSNSSVSRRRTNEDGHWSDPYKNDPVGEIPFAMMLLLGAAYALRRKSKLL